MHVLVDAGAEVNASNEQGRTPLHLAVEQGCLATVRNLMERRAAVMQEDAAGKAALQFAEELGDATIGDGGADEGAGASVATMGDAVAADGTVKQRIIKELQCMDAAIDGSEYVSGWLAGWLAGFPVSLRLNCMGCSFCGPTFGGLG